MASFGDGDGGYKKLMDKVPVYDSYDGAPFCENKTGGLVKFLDLSMPVFGLKLYDWIISLEVGEHIPCSPRWEGYNFIVGSTEARWTRACQLSTFRVHRRPAGQ